uniref:Uncharacterized protein n=1 Tax=Panagrolaimus sp. ES5 TaxID=591445 RepID=A0AC34FI15_9BILA
MAIASFWILTPQRTVVEEAINNVHYDRNFRNKSNLTHMGLGFYYMGFALLLSFFSMIASVILETIIAPTRIEYRKTATLSN